MEETHIPHGEFLLELAQGTLCAFLAEIERADRAPQDYDRRNFFVYQALAHAIRLNYRAGIALDPVDKTHPFVVYIDLPTGPHTVQQVSWHVGPYTREWDGHTTDEKYQRIARYINTHDLSTQ